MATTVTYKGQTLATVENQTKTLQTAGTWCEDDFTLTDVSGGGGISSIELLEEVTLTEDIHEISVMFDGYRNQGYASFALWVDLTITAEDWIYYGTNRGNSSYTAKTTTDTGWRSSFTDYGQVEFFSVLNSGQVWTGSTLTNFRVWCYTGSVNIQAGSKYKLYGVKYDANL